MMRSVIALAVALLAAANASQFLENPAKPSTKASGAGPELMQTLSVDESIESKTNLADDDDVQLMDISDADNQDIQDAADDASVVEDIGSSEESVDDVDDMESGLDDSELGSADDASDVDRMGSSEASVDDAEDAESSRDETEPGSSEMSDEIKDFGMDQADPVDMADEDASSMSEETTNDSKEQEHVMLEPARKSSQAIKKPSLEPARKSSQAIKKASLESARKSSESNKKAAVPMSAMVQPKADAKNDAPLSADGKQLFQDIRMHLSDLKDKVFAGRKFQAKVAGLCKKYSEMANCDAKMKEVVFCKLLRRSEPKAADHLCAGVSMDPAKYFSGKEEKNANIFSTRSSLQVKSEQMVKKFTKEMADDLEVNFDTIVPL